MLALLIIGCYFIYVGMDIFNFYWAIPGLDGENIYAGFGFETIFIDDLRTFFLITVASFTFFYNQLAIEKIKHQNEREKSLIVKELNYLKISI